VPDLYLLGTNRACSTSVWRFFEQHESCCTSMPKDPYYFERRSDYDQGLDHLFESYYGQWQGQPVIFFCRETSLMLSWVMPRILETSPSARFIVTLRAPVSRFFSQYAWRTVRGLETRTFAEVVDTALARWSSAGNVFLDPSTEDLWVASLSEHPRTTQMDYHLEAGLYADNLQPWLDVVDRSRFLILEAGDVARNGEDAARQLCDHARLDYADGPASVLQTNSWSSYAKKPWASGVCPLYDAAAATRLADFYAEPNARLCNLLQWSVCPWNET